MGENKVFKMLLLCSVISVMLLIGCTYEYERDKGVEGGITNCCGDLGNLDTEGLIIYYNMEDLPETIPVGTIIKDRSGNGNHGTFKRVELDSAARAIEIEENGKIAVSVLEDGIIGDALHIAKWDYIAILDSMIREDFRFGTGDFTWSLWVKPSERGPKNNNRNQVWIGAQQSDVPWCGDGTHMWLGLENETDEVNWQLHAAHINKDSTSQEMYNHRALKTEGLAGEWHHIVAVKDGHKYSDISIYIDGKEVKQYQTEEDTISRRDKVSMSYDYAFSNIDCLYLGMFPACLNVYVSTFTMDEVTMWNRPLSEHEVEMLYKAQKP